MNQLNFIGVKVALINKGKVLTILRDNLPNIPYPNMWDLAGGGRENEESPYETMRREVKEELAIDISESNIVWTKYHESITNAGEKSVFMVANICDSQIENIKFGEEGQKYEMLAFEDFIDNEDVIEQLKKRFLEYLNK
ncbi:NUDIX domain-containing protein [Facklamia sp. P12945]|uniref:NUDIX domain-containing protein n=1 Tax=unclassified Facklamia TaxID=2622293 RepID=UPI003D17907B